jgi:hypothetical protein
VIRRSGLLAGVQVAHEEPINPAHGLSGAGAAPPARTVVWFNVWIYSFFP